MADERAEARRQARREALRGALALCEREARRGGELPAGLEGRIAALRRLMAVGRLPRVAVVGRRGAGKSSLANALLGAPALPVGDVADRTGIATWRTLLLAGRRIDWMDTPGLRAAARRATRRAEIDAAVTAAPPDVVLVLCQASEVDAGVDDDLRDVGELLTAARRSSGVDPDVIGVVTKVDELAPPDVSVPFDDGEKQANIATAVAVFERHLARAEIRVNAVVPVATYVSWRGEQLAYDARWNIDALTRALIARLPDEAILRGEPLRLELLRAFRALGAEVIDAWADRAWAGGRGANAGEMAALEESLAAILAALGGEIPEEGAGASPVEILRSTRARGPTEMLRTGLARLGARRTGAWLASVHLRALGKALMTLEDAGLDLETARSLVPAPGSA